MNGAIRSRATAWSIVAAAVLIPVAAASTSPLLQWRDAIYIAAGLAGVAAMGLLLVQPLLIGRYLPGLPVPAARRVHRGLGVALVLLVVAHVAGLWLTSPPDVVDALLLRSPTPFSVWGVAAMWAVLATALLTATRHRLRPRSWRMGHRVLAVVIVAGTVVHAMLIEGTLGTAFKIVFAALVIGAAALGLRLTGRAS